MHVVNLLLQSDILRYCNIYNAVKVSVLLELKYSHYVIYSETKSKESVYARVLLII